MAFLPKKCLEIAVLIAVACAGGGAGPSTMPATSSDDDPVQFMAENQKAVEPWKKLSALPPRSITDVIRFSEQSGLLVAEWPMLKSGPQSGRIPLTDLPGIARIDCPGGVRRNNMLYPTFEYYDLTQPDFICRHLQVFSNETSLRLFQDAEGIHGFLQTISLFEVIGETDSPPVTLRVQIMHDFQPQINHVYSAATLDALRHDHPDEFDQYLRPMFRTLHQEQAVFFMDDRIAWQVLAEEWHPTPDLQKRLMAIVAQLDSTDFAQRQQAQKALHALGQPAALFLHNSDRRSWTPEQIARTDGFLAEYFILSGAKAKKLGSDVNFLLDCLANDNPDIQAAALSRLNSVLGTKIEYKIDQPPAERNAAIEQLRRQLTSAPPNPDVSK